jgi:hypothetical protein
MAALPKRLQKALGVTIPVVAEAGEVEKVEEAATFDQVTASRRRAHCGRAGSRSSVGKWRRKQRILIVVMARTTLGSCFKRAAVESGQGWQGAGPRSAFLWLRRPKNAVSRAGQPGVEHPRAAAPAPSHQCSCSIELPVTTTSMKWFLCSCSCCPQVDPVVSLPTRELTISPTPSMMVAGHVAFLAQLPGVQCLG